MGANDPSALSVAITSVTGAVSSVAHMVAGNELMLIGIAGTLIATGVGIFKSLTGQRKRRGR